MKKTLLSIICCLIFIGLLKAQTRSTNETKAFTSNTTWTVPQGVTEITIEAWGAGGAGGFVERYYEMVGLIFKRKEYHINVSAGGGGGAYAKKTLQVTPGETLSIVIGKGGQNTGTPADGGYSAVSKGGITYCKAAGGKTAISRTTKTESLTGAQGGAASDCIGNIRYSGGNGGNGDLGLAGAFSCSGGGGSAAGASGNGSNASLNIGGISNSPFSGNGAEGRESKIIGSWWGIGNAGNNYGGGGSGSVAGTLESAGKMNGGEGAPGYVLFTYTQNVCDANAGTIAMNNWVCASADTTLQLFSIIDATSTDPATYSWQKSNSESGTWSTLSHSNTKEYLSTQTGYYRRGYTVGGCPTAYSNILHITRPGKTYSGNILYQNSASNTHKVFCINNPASVTLTTTLSDEPDSILWQTSLNQLSWTNRATGSRFTFLDSNLNKNVYIRYNQKVSPTCTIPSNNIFSVMVTDYPIINNIEVTERVCFSEQNTLTAHVTDTTQQLFYTWFPASLEDGGANHIRKTPLPSENVLLSEISDTCKLLVKNKYGCAVSDSVVFYIEPRATNLPNIEDTLASDSVFTFTPTNVPENTTYSWTIQENVHIKNATEATNKPFFSTGVLWNYTLENQTITYQIIPSTTTNGKTCEGDPFTITLTVTPDLLNDKIITLWYGAEDSLYYVDSKAEYDMTEYTLTNNIGDENTGPLFNRISPGIYDITWTFTKTDGEKLVFTQNYIVRLPNCGENDPNYTEPFIVQDREGNNYSTVRVGADCWFAENLRSTTYAQEPYSAIPVAAIYHCAEYPNEETNLLKFGRLYSWYSALNVPELNNQATPTTSMDRFNKPYVQGACPNGWAIPSTEDYDRLKEFVEDVKNLQSSDENAWLPNCAGNENGSGFDAMGAGFYNTLTHTYTNLLGQTFFWTTGTSTTTVKGVCNRITHSCPNMLQIEENKSMGYSIRCIKKEVNQ